MLNFTVENLRAEGVEVGDLILLLEQLGSSLYFGYVDEEFTFNAFNYPSMIIFRWLPNCNDATFCKLE